MSQVSSAVDQPSNSILLKRGRVIEADSTDVTYERFRAGFDDLFDRCVKKLTPERIALAEYATSRFIQHGSRIFVQASTSTLALAWQLSEVQKWRCTILTNSALLTWLLLRQKNGHQVNVFGGPIFDDVCGG